MQYIADLHLHSKYSRAVSQAMVLPEMARVASEKGLDILTASDWTHPLWFKEISGQLREVGEGVYSLSDGIYQKTRFILTTEISCIYTQGGKLRRIHNLVFAPDLATAEKINKEMVRRGFNIMSDGRPIIGLSSKNLLEMILEIDERCILIPCHVWTPHFGLYGSASGFDSISEAYEELSPYIYGIETGLSSDPEMNWQIDELTNRSILSFSDAHSAPKMGREATVFDLVKPDFPSISDAIKQKLLKLDTPNKVVYTIEFYPEEGKYHFSGHRNCKVVFGPEEIRNQGNTCPVCHRRLTEGVLFRLQQLSDPKRDHILTTKKNQYGLKWYTDTTKHHPPYVKLVPLLEIIAESYGSTVFSQKVKSAYTSLVQACGSEFDVLLKTPIGEITKAAGEKVAQAVAKVRAGDITIAPGYDGEYGKVAIWQEGEEATGETKPDESQLSLDI